MKHRGLLPAYRQYPLCPDFLKSPGILKLMNNLDGYPSNYPYVHLTVRTKYGDSATMRFILDTGASISVIPVQVALREGIGFSKSHTGMLASSVGGTVLCYYDFITVQSALSGKPHRWPCAFADRQDSVYSPCILGRAGFLREFAFAISDDRMTVRYSHPLLHRLTQSFLRLFLEPDDDTPRHGSWRSI